MHENREIMKSLLMGTTIDPSMDFEDRNQLRFIANFSKLLKSEAYTMLPRIRLDNIEHCIDTIVRDGIQGDVIETGVWRGGATMYMRYLLNQYQKDNTIVWVADSFEGLPEPDETQFPIEFESYHSPIFKKYNRFAVGLEQVKQNFDLFGLLDETVKFLPGWFKNTLPTAPIEKLSLLRLDGDYYSSTMDALENLYPKLSPGGFCIIDDYGETSWTACAQACQDYAEKIQTDIAITPVDSKCIYWRK